MGPFSRQNRLVESQNGGLLLERSCSDPTETSSGPLLVQRVTPTVRTGLPSSPVTSSSKKHSNNPASDFPPEKGVVLDRDCNQEHDCSPLLFAEDCSQRPCSTPIADFAPESNTMRLSARFSELESQLQKQMDINRELKRLLVASIGSDLQYRLNQIAEEKATISQSLDTSLHQLAENHEEIDKLSIDCDIWRSKFLASRLMVDELAGWKAEVTRQLKESQRALQCMLKESTELGSTLLQCSHHLEGIVTHLGLKGRNVKLGSNYGKQFLKESSTKCFCSIARSES